MYQSKGEGRKRRMVEGKGGKGERRSSQGKDQRVHGLYEEGVTFKNHKKTSHDQMCCRKQTQPLSLLFPRPLSLSPLSLPSISTPHQSSNERERH
jgi:hypothetical protein